MDYTIGTGFSQEHFLVKGIKKFDWGIVGTLTRTAEGDIAFKFARTDLVGPEFDVGSVLQVTGSIAEYNGDPQVVGRCMEVNPTEDVLRQIMPVAPIDVDLEFRFMLDEVAHMQTDSLRAITNKLLHDYERKLRAIPAGMTMHHSCIGGWVEHTSGILRSALALEQVYRGRLNHDLLVSGAILHDIGKIYEFELTPLGLVKDYTFLGDGLGHATIGVGMITACAQELGIRLDTPILAPLLNIVGTHAGRREWGACAECVTKEAMVISSLDYIDSHINSLDDTLRGVPFGESEYSKALKGKVYQSSI